MDVSFGRHRQLVAYPLQYDQSRKSPAIGVKYILICIPALTFVSSANWENANKPTSVFSPVKWEFSTLVPEFLSGFEIVHINCLPMAGT